MKDYLSPLLKLCIVCVGLVVLWQPSAYAEAARHETSLIPAPFHSHTIPEDYLSEGPLTVDLGDSPALAEQLQWVAGLISDHTGRELALTEGELKAASIQLRQVSEPAMRASFSRAGIEAPDRLDEAYRLRVDASGVTIQAVGEAGLFYGLASLWQWLSSLPEESTVWPGLEVLDAPVFYWRGLMLDSARHMQSVAFIKRYLDWMSLHKLNVFHWHLTDDQAWRLEIKAYPRLTQVGGFRVPAGDAPAADIDPQTGNPRLYGGYYTQEEVRDIVEHAAKRFITVVPEVDVPGHATAAIAAYPELGVPGHDIEEVPASWGIFHNVFNLEESTFEFLEGVLREVVDLFPGPFIHLGGDEVETAQWENSERIRERMAELGIDDIQGVQNFYVERLQAFLDPYGRRVMGWDEILKSDLPPHAAVMSWRGVEGAIEAAAKGHQTVLSPAPTFYLDHIQTTAPDAPPGRGGVITVRDIYEFDPLPGNLVNRQDLVLGLQGNLWTEHVRTEQRAAYMTWPRAAAIAELGWSTPQNREWTDFSQRLPQGVARMQKLGIQAANDVHALYRQPLPVGEKYDSRREDRELELCSNAIVLALEDDAPLKGERESFLVDIQNPCWIWKDAPLNALSAVRANVGQLPFNFEIGESIHDVMVDKSNSEAGAFRVRFAGCDGPVVAEISLDGAVSNPGTTLLPAAPVTLPADAGETADLCFSFSRGGVSPIWVIDWVELLRETP